MAAIKKDNAAKDKAAKNEKEETVEVIEKETGEDGENGTAKPRKRGPYKKREGGPRKRAGAKKADAAALGQQIVGVHSMMAIVTGIPELEINEGEGKLLAEACISVAEEYGIAVSGKVGAAIQLFAACSFVYGPRALHFNNRMREQRGTVVDGEFTKDTGDQESGN